MGKKLRMKHVDTDDVGKQEQETNTEAICDDEQREEILDEDEITASETAFMEGCKRRIPRRLTQKPEHSTGARRLKRR